MIDRLRTPTVLTALAAAVVCVAVAGCGRRSAGVAAEREALRSKAAAQAAEEAAQAVSAEAIAQECGFDHPVPPPTATPEEIARGVTAETARQVGERFPDSAEERLRAEIEARYPVWKIGDPVSFELRGGLGRSTDVEGRLRETTESRVRVNDHWILKTDMTEADRARVDPDFRAALVDKEYRAALFLWRDDRQRFADRLLPEVTERLYTEAGYVRVGGRWQSRLAVFEERRQAAQRKEERRRRLAIEEQVFREAGYVLRDGEWQPSRLARIARPGARGRPGDQGHD